MQAAAAERRGRAGGQALDALSAGSGEGAYQACEPPQ
jgi:hypothetical protein